MPMRGKVLATVGGSQDCVRAGEEMGIPGGQAYLIATGLPADGGGTLPDDGRPGSVDGSTQSLVCYRIGVVNPVNGPEVHAWIRRRVSADPAMVAALHARPAGPGQVRDGDGHRGGPRPHPLARPGDHPDGADEGHTGGHQGRIRCPSVPPGDRPAERIGRAEAEP